MTDCLDLPESSDPRVTLVVQYRLQGKTWGDIARSLELSPRAVWDLRQRHRLDELIDAQVADLHRSGMIALKQHLGEAIRTTAEIMRDPEAAAKDRLAAAKEIMGWSKAPTVALLPVVPGSALASEAEHTATEELEAVVVSSRPANDNSRGRKG